jgi:hypothetical protein
VSVKDSVKLDGKTPVTYEFKSDPPDAKVWLKPWSLLMDGEFYDSPMDALNWKKYSSVVGTTPCIVPVHPGKYNVNFEHDSGRFSSRTLEVGLKDGQLPGFVPLGPPASEAGGK